ncbi:MAG TPA: hypothetical protein VIN40_00500 [Candidatus Tyrphobacter sp.]
MEEALIDAHLLDGKLSRAELVARLLATAAPTERARPFYEGMGRLGARTPELSLIALRLVLAGRRADDDSVVRLRGLVEAVRSGGPAARAAGEAYRAELSSGGVK